MTATANGVAKFRVTGVTVKGNNATVNITWEYQKDPNNPGLNGQGVQFHVHLGGPPGYNNATKGTAVGTVDMDAGGTGSASFTFDVSQLNAQPGQQMTLTGQWQNGHQWGVDAQRKGGEFTLPQKNSLLGRRVSSLLGNRGWVQRLRRSKPAADLGLPRQNASFTARRMPALKAPAVKVPRVRIVIPQLRIVPKVTGKRNASFGQRRVLQRRRPLQRVPQRR